MSNIIERLATSLGKKNQIPNIGLANQVVFEKDSTAVKVLIDNLYHKDKAIQSDCIKVLYEVGEKEPTLISEHLHEFLNLLIHKNNRLQWGGMAAIHSITLNRSKEIFEALPQILKAADKGSVITKDHAVGILLKLCSLEEFQNKAFNHLLILIRTAPDQQFPLYVEKAQYIIPEGKKAAFMQIMQERLETMEQESKRKRVEKILKELSLLDIDQKPLSKSRTA